MPQMTPYALQIWLAPGQLDEHPVLKNELTLGRSDKNDIILDSADVSGHHVSLSFANGQLSITDLGASNGTYLNGQRLAAHVPTQLAPGIVITIGPFSLSVRLTNAQAPPPLPVAAQVKMSSRPQQGLAIWVGNSLLKYPLDKGFYTLGRSTKSTITIQHPKVSGHHAQIQRVRGHYEIVDVGSANGMFHNAQRIQKKQLNDGDVIYLGQEVMVQYRNFVGLVPAVLPKKKTPPPPPPIKTLVAQGQNLIKIGRSRENGIRLNHPQVSRHHAQIERMGSRYRLIDLKSNNGVFVNKAKIAHEAWLKDGDEIRIGPYRFDFDKGGLQGNLEIPGVKLDIVGLQKWVSKPETKNLLRTISMSIEPGEFVALVGLSGAGKSTLMDAINGFRPATNGKVFANGDDLYDNFDMYRNDMGYVPQKDIVHKDLTVFDALDYAAQLRMPADTTPEARKKRVMEVLQELDLADRHDVLINKVSGGQLKRVSIGVELLTKPRLFFLDEPTSGLDPGTEFRMMKLLRQLADKGRTIMLVTHATKNVMMCDKVIILVRDGYLAYFGPPEEALTYFDQYRPTEEKRTKDIEFDDIYTILQDEKRKETPKHWAVYYRQKSTQYDEYVVPAENLLGTGAQLRECFLKEVASTQPAQNVVGPQPARPSTPTMAIPGASSKQVSALRQFMILFARNFKITIQDRAALIMTLLLAPVLGLMDLLWTNKLFDPADGNPIRIMMMLFVTAVITFLVGALSSVREIVKEQEIYKRERIINLKIMPYVLSKVGLGIVLALYQALVLLIFKIILVLPPGTLPAGDGAYLTIYVTMFFGVLTGYLLGLTISALTPSANSAMSILIAIVVLQIVFAGVLVPLQETPGHQIFSPIMSNKWTVEALVNVTGLGNAYLDDPCWNERDKEDREEDDGTITEGWKTILDKSNDDKLAMGCKCMGSNIFTECATFPGILDPAFYTDEAKVALESPEPENPDKPVQPTGKPEKPIKPEKPDTLEGQEQYQKDMEQYQKDMEQYQEDMDDYQKKMDKWTDDMDNWQDQAEDTGEDQKDWAEDRIGAIGSAEGNLEAIFDQYNYAFYGKPAPRWVVSFALMVAFFIIIVIAQKRKDVV